MTDSSPIPKESTTARKKLVLGLVGLLSVGSSMLVAWWVDIGLLLQQHQQITIALAGSAATCLYGWSLWTLDLLRENKRLKAEREENIQIRYNIEFRKGKRTGGKWLAFCPKCQMPAGWNTKYGIKASCTASCGWTCMTNANDIPIIIDELNKTIR